MLTRRHEAVWVSCLGLDGVDWISGPLSVLVPTQGATESPTAAFIAWFPSIIDIGEGGRALFEGRDVVANFPHESCGTFANSLSLELCARINRAEGFRCQFAIRCATYGPKVH